MSKIKAYTDLEQSKKLAEILPPESADMCYIQDLLAGCKYGEYKPYIGDLIPAYGQGKIKCWSLAALLSVLEHPRCFQGDKPTYWFCGCFGKDKLYHEMEADNPIDACVAMIEKLHELEMLEL